MSPVIRAGMSAAQANQPSNFVPSPQQRRIFSFACEERGNAIVVAVAGAGKSTTLKELCSQVRGTIVYCAFNSKIAKEMADKFERAGFGTNAQSKTFHSLGFSAWRKVAPTVRSDPKKMDTILGQLSVPRHLLAFVGKIVSLAKQAGIGIVSDMTDDEPWLDLVDHFDLRDLLSADEDNPRAASEDELLELALSWSLRALQESNDRDMQVVDFDDMIYTPLFRNARFWQYDWVLVDEAQDTNVMRRELAKRILRPGGRLIAVGDPKQAIYGFTGANADALDLIRDEFGCTELPLTVTYRCAKAIVRVAQEIVPYIQAHESAPEGIVRRISEKDFMQQELPTFLENDDTRHENAILCRNTKPLVRLAFDLIRRRIPCHVEGRDIGQGLITLCRKWKSVTDIGELRERLEDFLESEEAKLLARGKETKVDQIKDKVETLFVLMDQLADDDPISALISSINALFQDTLSGEKRKTITLSTVHKSKGREWRRVYLLGRNKYMPSPYAKQAWSLEQENNLIYVAVTRAMEELVEVTVLG